MAIAPNDFELVRELVRRKAGIVLEPGKEYLVESRLSALARQEKLDGFAAVVAKLRGSSMDPINTRVVEAMTTNETSFFRDIHPFEALKKTILPTLASTRAASKTLNIWCGASSTGQEPYTIAMTLMETIPDIASWNINFVATDLSREMIARSRAGKYNQIEINRGLPAALMVKYFEKQGLEWQIKEPLRKMVEFREMNLTTAWPPLPMMDIVFLRNVLIYFDANTKREILLRIRRILKPDGHLFLGGAETTMSLDDAYERMQIEKTGCYRVRPAVPVVKAA
jgi:chemotaxis protein methyltransferase CheR